MQLDVYGFSPTLRACLEGWLRYKAEKRQAYTPTGLAALLDEVRARVASLSEARVTACVRTSMANGWQGIAWNAPPASSGVLRPVRETAQHRYTQRSYTEAELNALLFGEEAGNGC